MLSAADDVEAGEKLRSPVTIYVALGSNLGDRLENLTCAVELLSEKVSDIQPSSIYETPPWGVLDQPRFLNQVVRGMTTLTPHQLLDFLKSIEKKMGREETIRFGPRVIDLDILLYGERQITAKRLQIPHPRMLERAFVMVPLNELSPDLLITGTSQPVHMLLKNLDQTGIVKIQA